METETEEILIIDIGKNSYWVFPGDRVQAVIQGGAKDDDDEEEDTGDEDDDDDDDDESDGDKGQRGKRQDNRKFSQRAVNAIVAKEARAASRKAAKDMLNELGFESIDKAREALAGKQKEDEKETSKTQERLSKAERERDEARADALQARFDAKCERQLLRAGAKPSRVDKLVKLLDLEIKAGDDEIGEEIDSLRDDFPELFVDPDESDNEEEDRNGRRGTDTRNNGKKGMPDSDTGRSRKKQKGASPEERARERIVKEFPHLAKSQ